ncbi:MAG: hypothetical protein HXX11_13070 [Desulfuromonadales bacterium]|nr:hypothetical protein [Desulfuromonadales bacterium]
MNIITKLSNIIVVVFIILLVFFSHAIASNIGDANKSNRLQNKEDHIKYKSRYQNNEFKYSFEVPDNLACLGDPSPAPNHGCIIYLSQTQKSFLWVNADYNVADSLSPTDEFLRGLDPLVKDGMEITVLNRSDFPLKDLHGERFTLNYKKINNHEVTEPTVQDMVIAIRTIEGYGEIIYTFGLSTPKSSYQKDKIVFDTIIKSWTSINVSVPHHK